MKKCPYCSSDWQDVFHTGLCPRVKSYEYYEDGTIKKVEFNEDTPEYFPTRPLRKYKVEWLIS